MTTEIKSTSSNTPTKKKFKLKMPSALAIIIGVVVFVTILTWIPHWAGNSTDGLEAMGWDPGSLAAWQNQIFQQNLPAGADLAAAQNVVDKFGLDGDCISAEEFGSDPFGSGWIFITETSVPWTISGYSDGASAMFGLFDVPKALLGGYFNALDVAFYLIGIYAIVLLLMETNTLKDGVSSLVKGLGGREIILVPTLFVLFSLGGTLFGMQEETLGLLPIIVPVLILAGFDAITGMLVAVLGTTTGIAASVLDPFSVGVFAAGLGEDISVALVERMLLFFVYTSIGAIFVTWYASRVNKNPEKSAEKERIEENKVWAEEHIGNLEELETMSGKQKAAMWIFAIVFAWMVLSLMPWTEWITGLADNQGWIIFSSIFYGHVLFGEWYFVELGILFLIAVFLIGKIFNMETSKIMGTVWQSSKEMFGVITIISFSRATASILSVTGLTYGMIYGTINTDTLAGANPIVFSMIWLLIFSMMAFFIPSTSGLAGITAPIAGGVIDAAQIADAPDETLRLMTVGLLMVYPLAQGCINMFSPTTGLVVVQAEQSKVTFGRVLPILASYAATIFVVGAVMTCAILGIEMAM